MVKDGKACKEQKTVTFVRHVLTSDHVLQDLFELLFGHALRVHASNRPSCRHEPFELEHEGSLISIGRMLLQLVLLQHVQTIKTHMGKTETDSPRQIGLRSSTLSTEPDAHETPIVFKRIVRFRNFMALPRNPTFKTYQTTAAVPVAAPATSSGFRQSMAKQVYDLAAAVLHERMAMLCNLAWQACKEYARHD